jgi:hypothetical protein
MNDSGNPPTPDPYGRVHLSVLAAGIGLNALRVYIALASFVGRGAACNPSLDKLANRAHLRRDSVMRAVAELEAANLVSKQRRTRSDGGDASTGYTLIPMVHAPPEDPGTENQSPGEDKKAVPGGVPETCPPRGHENGRPRKDHKKRLSSSKLRFSPEDLATAEWMFQQIRDLDPTCKPPDLEKWAQTVRLMRECDGRSDASIRATFAWANADTFWKSNVLSPSKLREKWTTLAIKMKTNGRPAGHRVGPGQRHPAQQDRF